MILQKASKVFCQKRFIMGEKHFSQQQQRMLNEVVIIISAAAAQKHIFRVCSIRRSVCSLKVLFTYVTYPKL